jgi:phosphoglycolate phosphatase
VIHPESVIWDFNGTLLNDVALSTQAVSELSLRRGLPGLDIRRHRQNFGFPIWAYYERLGFDLTKEVHAELSEEFHDAYLAGVEACALNEGVLELLQFFGQTGASQFVLSAAEQTLLDAWVGHHGIETFFHGTYGLADNLGSSKTDRGTELLQARGIDPARTLFIGDTDHDVEVALALGCHPVIVLEGHQGRASFEGLECLLYEDFHALLHTLKQSQSYSAPQ